MQPVYSPVHQVNNFRRVGSIGGLMCQNFCRLKFVLL